ncbi:MAG: tRNA (N6-threonylcarbamoyladenosine(37)-N6)-methyltransferase TrmO [Candidatus Brockarchaeota archaeon]|nr:tRNA (N6-threonylcarbamoyladenosine(37)-N6)-methyltransferase TrmO [Candidatus Brockarchaeota archaeon]MBO3842681.1 tRNA (N6-threonylcarbamoyladenosine(37)-N6)-methyltransferase TrmO [Candidatus Brockarchaeota archaeon]
MGKKNAKHKAESSAEVRFIGFVESAGEDWARIRIYPEFCNGLKGIEGFSHLIVIYWLHLCDSEEERRTLLVYPKRRTVNVLTGVFACRSPTRPNPVGICVVELLKREECSLKVRGLDAFEKSPVIDIKPYIPRIDSVEKARTPEWAC